MRLPIADARFGGAATHRLAVQQCPRQDSNLYVLSNTGPSNQPVYQFQHVGANRYHVHQCSGRDSNPHGVNPHRILNPARLPIPPPERAVAGSSADRNGAEGNRTPDLLNAIQALSHLSYGPEPANVPRLARRHIVARLFRTPADARGAAGRLAP